MSSKQGHPTANAAVARLSLAAAGVLCATALAGCSADLGRFDMANASFNSNAPRQRVASAPTPSEPLRRSNAGGPVDVEPAAGPPPATPYAYNPAPYQPPLATAPVRLAGLPEPTSREATSREPVGRAPETRRNIEPPARGPAAKAPRATPEHAASAGGETIEVQQGDTLYGIAKKHRVAISELMSVNSLQTPMIRPGQKLALPAGRRAVPARKGRTTVAAAPPEHISAHPTSAPGRVSTPAPAPVQPPAAAPSAEPPAGWNGAHTVTPRDSLYNLARRYNVTVAALQSANGITDPARLRAGTVLKVPGAASANAAGGPAAAPAREEAPSSAPIARPTIINPAREPERVAVAAPRAPVMTDASAEAEPAAPPVKPSLKASIPGKFRWPAKGRVVASFGPRGDNTHNDGINILVPQGTSVMAAEGGVVAYAGSELKGYGNLVLIRHEGNWVSAYAHNESLLVKRGDRVERGQAIAKAGKTGAVDQPQVHFELRQGSKPVDPMPHLEK